MSETPCPFCGQIHGTACNATTPANPTGQIATVAATPVVAHDAQRYDWREELDMATDYGMSLAAAARVAAYIERLEAERDALQSDYNAMYPVVFAAEDCVGNGGCLHVGLEEAVMTYQELREDSLRQRREGDTR